jgi:hypothetical protein
MFLDSLAPVDKAVRAGRAAPVQAALGVAVIWAEGLLKREHDRLHKAKVCRGCFWFVNESEEGPPNLARRGLYVYDHLTENWISGPYGRQQQPSRPVHVDELPPDLRRELKHQCFKGFCFAQTLYIQPVEHFSCMSWEAGWLDVTGKKIRPLPGQEEEYAEAYGELVGNKEYDVEPPPKKD